MVAPAETLVAPDITLRYVENGGLTTLTFGEFIPASEVDERIREIAVYLGPLVAEHTEPEEVVVVPLLNGATQVADDLMARICDDYPAFGPKIVPMKVKSYNGTQNGQLVVEQDAPEGAFKGKIVIAVDEVVDRAHSMDFLVRRIAQERPAIIYIVALACKPDAHEVPMPPPAHELDVPVRMVVGYNVPPDFLLGRGMDWHEMGRWLRPIYRLRNGTDATYTKPPFPSPN